MNWKVPYFELSLGQEEKDAALAVLNSNWLTTGPKIKEFESNFSDAIGGNVESIAVSNCTVALHLALVSIGVSAGDEVICPSLTFVATANSVRYCNAVPVFADVCSEADWTVCPEDIETKITSRTKAILLVHYGGYPCQLDRIMEIAKKHKLAVIEDSCHALFSTYKERALGTFGEIGCFSFFGNKNMTTGEGGMIVTKNADLAQRIRVLRSHGMSSTSYERYQGHSFGYDVVDVGYNYRLDEMRAAIGIEQLKKLKPNNIKRVALVEKYRQHLKIQVPAVSVPFRDRTGEDYSYHVFAVLLPKDYTDRLGLMKRMAGQGIQTSFHYRPVHTFNAYKEFRSPLPVTDEISNRILSLPLFPTMRLDQVEFVVNSLKECL